MWERLTNATPVHQILTHHTQIVYLKLKIFVFSGVMLSRNSTSSDLVLSVELTRDNLHDELVDNFIIN